MDITTEIEKSEPTINPLQEEKIEFENTGSNVSSFLNSDNLFVGFSAESFSQISNSLFAILQADIFGKNATSQDIFNRFESIQLLTGLCGKVIPMNDLCFSCIDCDRVDSKQLSNLGHTIQCKQCFENSDHEGHRTFSRVVTDTAICDCGDIAVWAKKGFCGDHQGYSKDQAEKVLSQIPKDVENAFISVFLDYFYILFRFIEDNEFKLPQIQEALFTIGVSVLKEIQEINECFKLLSIKLLQSTFHENQSFRHDCSNVQHVSFKETKGPCECSLLELIFRFNCYLGSDAQMLFCDFHNELLFHHDFRRYFTSTYTKMIHFCIYTDLQTDGPLERTHDNILEDPLWTKKADRFIASQIQDYALQYLMTEELCLTSVNSGFFNNFIDLIRRLLRYTCCKEISSEALSALTVLNLSYIFAQVESARAFLQQEELIESLFDTIMDVQNTDRVQLYNFIENAKSASYLQYHHSRAIISHRLLNLFDNVLTDAFSIDNIEIREKVVGSFGAFFTKKYQTWRKRNQDTDKGPVINFYPLLVQTFGCFVSFLGIESLDHAAMRKRLQAVLGVKDDDFQEMCENLICEAVKTVVFFKALPQAVSLKGFSDLMDQMTQLASSRSHAKMRFLDYEILLAQICCSVLPDKTRIRTALEAVLNTLCSTTENSDEIALAPPCSIWQAACFEVFSLIMRDEISFANLIQRRIKFHFEPAKKLKSFANEVIGKAIVNYLHIFPTEKVETINKQVATCIRLRNECSMLDSITIFNEQTNKLRLKEEWHKRGIDPQIFSRHSALHKKFEAALREIALSDPKFDSILGCPEPAALAFYAQIEREIGISLLSGLQKYINSAVEMIDAKQSVSGLMLLTYRCLKAAEQASKHEIAAAIKESDFQALKDSVHLFIQTAKAKKLVEDNASALSKILACVNNLEQKLTTKSEWQSPTFEEKKQEMFPEPTEDPKEKQRLLLQRQKEIREKFLKKQQNFVEKADIKFEDTSKEDQASKQDSMICQFCREVIDVKIEKYGYPAFITRTNFSDYCRQRQKEDLQNASSDKGKSYRIHLSQKEENLFGYFTISSCYHHMHVNCYEKFSQSEIEIQSKMTSTLEFFCNVCKVLCNFFVPVSSKETKRELEHSPSTKEDYDLTSLIKSIPDDMSDVLSKAETEECGQEVSQFIGALVSVNADNLYRRGLGGGYEEKPDILLQTMITKYSEQIDLVSLQHFYNSEYHALGNCCTLLRNLYWSQSQQNKKYFEDKAQGVKKLLDKLAGNNSEGDNAEFTKELITDNDYATKIILELLWNVFMTKQDSEKLVRSIVVLGAIIELLKQFVEDKWLAKAESGVEMDMQIAKDALKMFVFENIEAEMPDLLAYLRKIVTMVSSIGDFYLESDYKDLLNASELLTLLLGLQNSKEIKEVFAHFMTSNEAILESLLKGIHQHLAAADRPERLLLKNVPIERALAVMPLPEDYKDFRSLYQKEKCCICNEFPTTGCGFACLICGKLFCQSKCKSNSTNQVKVGNLNVHALVEHCGISAFIEIEFSAVFLLNFPKNVLFKAIYETKYGLRISPAHKAVDWNEYKLNKQGYAEIKKLIVQNQVPQKICRIIDGSEDYEKDGFM